MTTPKLVNAALKKAGLNVKIVRNLRGGSYYYFLDDGFDKVPSIYCYSIGEHSTEEIVDHVKEALKAA